MSRRRGQVLPFTLTELLALLFFALALALVYQWSRRRSAERVVEDHKELIEASATLGPAGSAALARLVTSSAAQVPDDFRELARQLESDQEMREALRSELREVGVDSLHVDTAHIGALVDTVLALRRRAEREAEAFAAAAGLADSGRSAIQQLSRRLEQAEAHLERSEGERVNLRGQVANLQRRVGNGLDHPPCWADAAGNIEYAFQVTIRTNTVTVQPIWPVHREDDARRIPGMVQLIGEDWSYQEFSHRGFPIFAWSRRQEPECRHFVKLDDQVDGGKEAFKTGLLTVENFFYKLLLK